MLRSLVWLGSCWEAHGLIHRCITPVWCWCHPLKTALLYFQLLETVVCSMVKASVQLAVGYNFFHKAYKLCNSKLLLKLL